jgi:preprotein translocase subunit SecD
VILRCKVAGCAPGARLGTTDVTATTPILQVIVPNRYLQPGSAFAHRFQFDGRPGVSFRLRGAGKIDWCTFTTTHQNSYTAPVLDHKVLIDLEIVGPACEPTTMMPGLATMQEAKAVASYINYGPLPVPLSVVSTQATGR